MSKQTYSTAEICEMFAIHKSTLFRWENEEAWFPTPERESSNNGQRQYMVSHIKAISNYLNRQLYRQAIRNNDTELMRRAHVNYAFTKIVAGSETGFADLEAFGQHQTLPSETISALLKNVQQFEPDSPAFQKTIQLIYDTRVKKEA